MLLPLADKHNEDDEKSSNNIKTHWKIFAVDHFGHCGAFAIWLRIEPAEVTECEANFRMIQDGRGNVCIPEEVARPFPVGSGPM